MSALADLLDEFSLLDKRSTCASQAMAQAARLIDRLPETADGVPVLPGDTVWHMDICMAGRPVVSTKVTRIMEGGIGGDHLPVCVAWSTSIQGVPYWSSRERAMRHRAEVFAEEARQARAELEE